MRKAILIAAILLTQMAISQIKKDVGEFDALKVFDRISVTLVPSDENRIEITGTRSGEVEVINKNGELKIRMQFKKLLNGEEIAATLFFKRLESVDASEGSFISCDKVFSQSALDITAKEGAQIKLALDVQKADVKAVTGGEITLTGKAVNQEVSIGTGGILKAKQLETSQTTVSVSAGGEAKVNASELVDAKVRAGGSITIYGKPDHIEQKTTLGGTIEQASD